MEKSSCLKTNDLLSFAKKITHSNLVSNCSPKNANPNPSASHLIYNNILPDKERSRSVKSMMSSLLRHGQVVTEITKTKEERRTGHQLSTLSTNYRPPELSSTFISNNSNNNDLDTSLTSIKTEASPSSLFKENNKYSKVTHNNYNQQTTYLLNHLHQNMSTRSSISSHEGSHSFINATRSPSKDMNTVNSNSTQETMINGYAYANGYGNGNGNNGYGYSSNQDNQFIYIPFEDLIVLEGKLFHILDNLRNGRNITNFCMEWWNFYTFSSICGELHSFFKDTVSQKTIQESSNLELLSIISIYELLKEPKTPQTSLNIIKNLLTEIHQNFLVVCDYLLSRISMQSMTNIWLNKIQNLILSKRTKRIYRGEHLNVIKKNNDYIMTIFKNLFRAYSMNKKLDLSSITYFFKRINTITIKAMNDYFRKKINIDCCKSGNTMTFHIKDTVSLPTISVPYLGNNNIVKRDSRIFTLVLDLDETLIAFKHDEEGNGILKIRPGLFQFLKALMAHYELVIFTAGTQDYADPILDIIEKTIPCIDKRLYRQHAVIIENVFVKDLSKLGRDLSKVIIVDNIPQNFKLQKENGIFIKSFYGDEEYDTALLDLTKILLEIASYPGNDVRKELKRLRNEIFTTITTNLQNEDQNN